MVGFALMSYTQAHSATPYTGPEAGSVGLTGIVPAKPPTVAATIDKPTNGQRFATSPIEVSGTCPKDTLVELFKSDIFAGSTTCSSTGTYSLDVDLLIGENILIARVYDALNQAGPDSNSVTVFYDALPPQNGPTSSFDFGGTQLLLNTDAVFRGSFPGEEMVMPIEIIGGTPPYALNIQWGDLTNKVVPRNDNFGFSVSHTYKKGGVYQVGLQASDSTGRVAFLTVAAIINGQPDPSIVAATTPTKTNTLLLLWPLYVGLIAVVISFWLGEQREKQVLRKRGILSPVS